MKHSDKIDLIAPALAKAQAAFQDAKKDGKNPHFNSTFATLGSVWDACETALQANGLSILQGFSTEGPHGSLWTMVLHTSGQYIMGTCPLVLGKLDPQGVGSATTYYRRYGLAAMLGIIQEDDDGNGAQPDKPKLSNLKPIMATASEQNELDDHLANIEAASNMAELQTAWAKIPTKLQVPCTKAKEAKKAQLAKGSN